MNDRLLEAKEVAAMLACPLSWVREQTRRAAAELVAGELPAPAVERGRQRAGWNIGS